MTGRALSDHSYITGNNDEQGSACWVRLESLTSWGIAILPIPNGLTSSNQDELLAVVDLPSAARNKSRALMRKLSCFVTVSFVLSQDEIDLVAPANFISLCFCPVITACIDLCTYGTDFDETCQIQLCRKLQVQYTCILVSYFLENQLSDDDIMKL